MDTFKCPGIRIRYFEYLCDRRFCGGNYLALHAAITTNPAYAENFSFKVPDNLHLKAINLNCGVYQLTDAAYVDGFSSKLMWDVLFSN